MAAAPGADFVTRVLEVVADIPEGHVMTYGDVAAAIGSRAARGVGQVMAYSGSDVPWWRVVRASGHPASGHEMAALEHFRAEATPLLWSRGFPSAPSASPAPSAHPDAAPSTSSQPSAHPDAAPSTFRVDLARARWSPPLFSS